MPTFVLRTTAAKDNESIVIDVRIYICQKTEKNKNKNKKVFMYMCIYVIKYKKSLCDFIKFSKSAVIFIMEKPKSC